MTAQDIWALQLLLQTLPWSGPMHGAVVHLQQVLLLG
jgi:hypothetical protein